MPSAQDVSIQTHVTQHLHFSEPRWTTQESELTPEDASNTFAATPPLEGLRFMLDRCMSGARREPARVRVLGLYDPSRVHVHSKARRTLVIRGRSFSDEEGEHSVENFMLCSFAHRACVVSYTKSCVRWL